MTIRQKKIVESYIRKEIRKHLTENNNGFIDLNDPKLRSWDLWENLISFIENNQNRPSAMSSNYSGSEIFDALHNLLTLMYKRWGK